MTDNMISEKTHSWYIEANFQSYAEQHIHIYNPGTILNFQVFIWDNGTLDSVMCYALRTSIGHRLFETRVAARSCAVLHGLESNEYENHITSYRPHIIS